MRARAPALASLALSVACRGEDWIVAGELPPEPGAASDEGQGKELVTTPDACPSSLDVLDQHQQAHGAPSVGVAHVGRWRGELGEAAAVGFPSLEVELDIDASGAGTLLFGARASERAPYERDEGYLCSAETTGVVCGSESGFVGGFAYRLLGARSRDDVLTFVLATAEPWGSWCAEREPVSWGDPNQACGVAFGVLPPAELRYAPRACARVTVEGTEAIDCALMYALENCQCARDACFARLDRSVDVGLALSPDGTALRGSLWYEDRPSAASLELRRSP